MTVLDHLSKIWEGVMDPFLIYQGKDISFSDVLSEDYVDLSSLRRGQVVAIIGDLEPGTILTLLRLIDQQMIVVPLTNDTRPDHEYFFESALVDAVVFDGKVRHLQNKSKHPYIEHLRKKGHGGLILFSTGTTGRPKAILHDIEDFLIRFKTPRPALRTLNFLLFDHIGGLNTLFHTLYNKGVVITPTGRTVDAVLHTALESQVEVLPTTPTFLRMLLLSGSVPEKIPESIKIITYGTERMDQPTLDALCRLLPNVDFRQTFGMSELGILRVKSEARNSLYMRIGGEGVETKIANDVLQIRAETRMIGYLNAETPFDSEGWYDTKDVVEIKGDFMKVVGRSNDIINVGGLKFMASEVERIALDFEGVEFVKVYSVPNPITGEHAEIDLQTDPEMEFDTSSFRKFLSENLRPHMIPRRIRHTKIEIGHRFKRK